MNYITKIFVFSFYLLLIDQAFASNRFALVIGNDNYEQIGSLKKAVNDSRAISQTLTDLGFKVFRYENLTKLNMFRNLQQFSELLQSGDEALFYYAGHGVEISGINYLLPTDILNFGTKDEDLIKSEAISVNQVLETIQRRGARLALLFIDACRNNPFKSNGITRSIVRSTGLAAIAAPEGAFIMYSAGAGQEALDRLSDEDTDPNSVFTRSLLPLMMLPDFSLNEIARQVRRDVKKLALSVNHKQRPAIYDEIDGDFLFVRGERATPKNNIIPISPPENIDPDVISPLNTDRNWFVSIYNNLDFYGGDIHSKGINALSQSQCELECEIEPQCRMFTYNRQQQKCYLKNELAIALKNRQATSGFYFKSEEPDPPGRQVQVNWNIHWNKAPRIGLRFFRNIIQDKFFGDYYNSAVRKYYFDDFQECAQQCNQSHCQMFVVTRRNNREIICVIHDKAKATVAQRKSQTVYPVNIMVPPSETRAVVGPFLISDTQ